MLTKNHFNMNYFVLLDNLIDIIKIIWSGFSYMYCCTIPLITVHISLFVMCNLLTTKHFNMYLNCLSLHGGKSWW